MGSTSQAALEDAQVKAHEAWLAYSYVPAMPRSGDEDEEEYVDRLEEDAWYDSMYPQGEGGEDAEGWDDGGADGQSDIVEG